MDDVVDDAGAAGDVDDLRGDGVTREPTSQKTQWFQRKRRRV